MALTALYFGSFNPIHRGHLAVADFVIEEGIASEVWLVLSPQNPHKPTTVLADEHHRLAMAQRAVEGHRGVKVCDVEFTMPKPSYTALTIDRLRELYPDREFAILGGEDVAQTMHTWFQGERLMAENTILIYPRKGGVSGLTVGAPFKLLEGAPLMEQSSTRVREQIAADRDDWKHDVPESIITYIIENKLYI